MWRNHPFRLRNKTKKEQWGRVGVWAKLKKGVGYIGGLHKLWGLGTLCQL